MLANKAFILKFSVFLIVFFLNVGPIQANEKDAEDKESITAIAKIYQASMAYIFHQQSLINSHNRVKGELFGQHFIDKVQNTYNEMFNQPFPERDKHVSNLLMLMMLVMEDNRTLILDDDIGFKGFIPAIFAFQLSQKYKERGMGLNIKFTNAEQRVRNKLNSPDYWEQNAIAALADGITEEVFDNNASYEGKPALRYMRAVEMTIMCLNCHGALQDNPTNKGRKKEHWQHKDKTGFLMEGWKLSELGGGISVVLYQRTRNAYEK